MTNYLPVQTDQRESGLVSSVRRLRRHRLKLGREGVRRKLSAARVRGLPLPIQLRAMPQSFVWGSKHAAGHRTRMEGGRPPQSFSLDARDRSTICKDYDRRSNGWTTGQRSLRSGERDGTWFGMTDFRLACVREKRARTREGRGPVAKRIITNLSSTLIRLD
jgi:hypothetical protein